MGRERVHDLPNGCGYKYTGANRRLGGPSSAARGFGRCFCRVFDRHLCNFGFPGTKSTGFMPFYAIVSLGAGHVTS